MISLSETVSVYIGIWVPEECSTEEIYDLASEYIGNLLNTPAYMLNDRLTLNKLQSDDTQLISDSPELIAVKDRNDH